MSIATDTDLSVSQDVVHKEKTDNENPQEFCLASIAPGGRTASSESPKKKLHNTAAWRFPRAVNKHPQLHASLQTTGRPSCDAGRIRNSGYTPVVRADSVKGSTRPKHGRYKCTSDSLLSYGTQKQDVCACRPIHLETLVSHPSNAWIPIGVEDTTVPLFWINRNQIAA